MAVQERRQRRRWRPGYGWLVLPALLVAVLLFVLPIGAVVRFSLFDPDVTLKNFDKFFAAPIYGRIILNTLQVAGIVTLLSALIGYPAAYVINRLSGAWKTIAVLMVVLPLWTSVLIRSYSWSVLLGTEGIVNTLQQSVGLSDGPWKLLYRSETVFVAMTQILMPIMILTCLSAMARIDNDLVRAARVFGAGPLRAFWRVFFPLSIGGLINGTLLIFILSLGFFITPALVGGPKDILIANLIEQQINQLVNWGFGSALAVIVLLIALVVVVLMRLTNRDRYLDVAR